MILHVGFESSHALMLTAGLMCGKRADKREILCIALDKLGVSEEICIVGLLDLH